MFGKFSFSDDPVIDPENIPEESKPTKRRTTQCLVRSDKHHYRRAFSETQILEALGAGFEFMDGNSYHFITAGDVDAMSYLQTILRKQRLEYCLFSTWCMAAEDIICFDDWLTDGTIQKLDAYVGEIFPSTYRIEHEMLKQVFEKHQPGRIAVFRNHSKIFAGYGEKFAFGIQTSANINTNPRTENGCITIGREIFDFYKSYFDNIKSFE